MPKHLWEIEKNVISRDLRGKYVMLYGKPKSGKTTAACSFPDAVLFAFEKVTMLLAMLIHMISLSGQTTN